MESYEDKKNRQLKAMLEPARERLKKYTPREICEKAKVSFDEEKQVFFVESLGHQIEISYPDFIVREELEMWHHLTILQYLDTADGSSLSDRWIGLGQMRGGLSRGRGFDKDIETMFGRYFSETTPDQFRAACQKLGGKEIQGKADVSMVIYYAPMFPVLVSFWEADDEFSASGKTLVDAGAEHYLEIEAAGGACSAIIQEIRKVI